MKERRHRVRTRRFVTVSRDSGGEVIEVKQRGRWIGYPRWLFAELFEHDDQPHKTISQDAPHRG